MELLDYIMDYPKEYGEDGWFFNSEVCGVIDVSTPIDAYKFKGKTTQAEWFKEELFKSLIKSKSFFEGCYRVVNKYINDEEVIELEEYNKPCAFISSIEYRDEFLRLNILGNCLISVLYEDGTVQTFEDKRMDKYSNKTIKVKKKVLKNGLDVESEVRKQMIENREYMNVERGFWTVSFNNSSIEGVKNYLIFKESVDKVLLYSDGYDRLFKMSDISVEDILMQKVSLNESLLELRKLEELNTELKMDDATSILVRV